MPFKKCFSLNGLGKELPEWKSITGGVPCIQAFACGSNFLSLCLQIVKTPRVYNTYDKYMH